MQLSDPIAIPVYAEPATNQIYSDLLEEINLLKSQSAASQSQIDFLLRKMKEISEENAQLKTEVRSLNDSLITMTQKVGVELELQRIDSQNVLSDIVALKTAMKAENELLQKGMTTLNDRVSMIFNEQVLR